MTSSIKRTYQDFAGVDFANDSSLVSLSRSPDALNVYKKYNSDFGSCIETRPGIEKLCRIGTKIMSFYMFNITTAIVHSGNKLYKWSNFPSEPTEETLLEISSNMNANNKASFIMLKNKLYILDGLNYLVYDGTTLESVSANSFVPTTSISRAPSGGGELLEDVNLLSKQRINTFLANGTDKEYCLDAQSIESVDEVKINDVIRIKDVDYTVNTSLGKVIFTEVPPKPLLDGKDNVSIKFSKTIEGYADRINHCTKMILFDNRIFYTGNIDFPNAIFNSELNTPNYVSDLNYYEDGSNDSKITDFIVGNNILWVFKDKDQNNANIFYHSKNIDKDTGKIYPSKQGNIGLGCVSKSFNFNDDIVYLSKRGLEGISNDLEKEQIISHRSTLVDSKMINESNYREAQMTEWNGYLCILIGRKIYLADTRQKFSQLDSFEYDWYYWDFRTIIPSFIKEYDRNLYIGTDNGSIFVLNGTNDDGETILSYWTTPLDNFGYSNILKTTNKRGGVAKIKTMQNGKIKLAVKSNKIDGEKYISEKSLSGFSFLNLNFSNFSFTTSNQSSFVYKIKEKKFNEIAIKFYSDEKNKPFGLYSATLEAFVGGYIKK